MRMDEMLKVQENHDELMAEIARLTEENRYLGIAACQHDENEAEQIERITALRNALNEVVTNGEWTDGEQCGDWKISKEVYETAREAMGHLPVRSNIDRRLPALWQAIVDHTQGEEMFWIGEFLLFEITKETGYTGPAIHKQTEPRDG